MTGSKPRSLNSRRREMSKTLRQFRIEKGWTLAQLGQQMARPLGQKSVRPQVVSDWELTGRCHPSVVPALAKVFAITEQDAREMMEATEEAARAGDPEPAAAKS